MKGLRRVLALLFDQRRSYNMIRDLSGVAPRSGFHTAAFSWLLLGEMFSPLWMVLTELLRRRHVD